MSRVMGLFVCLMSLVVTGAFIWGLVLRSYWAIAIPVALVTLGLLGLIFWIGWALAISDWVAPLRRRTPRRTEQPSRSVAYGV